MVKRGSGGGAYLSLCGSSVREPGRRAPLLGTLEDR